MNPSYNSDPTRKSTRSESSYSPSVPVSVYRELAAELQATKAMVDSLSAQNNHLNNQNHLLRQNIHQMVQVALEVGNNVGVVHPAEIEMNLVAPQEFQSYIPTERTPQPIQHEPQQEIQPDPKPKVQRRPKAKTAGLAKVFTEQTGENRRYNLDASASGNMSTLWLLVSIAIIIFTAFGAGFLIMRPLLSDR